MALHYSSRSDDLDTFSKSKNSSKLSPSFSSSTTSCSATSILLEGCSLPSSLTFFNVQMRGSSWVSLELPLSVLVSFSYVVSAASLVPSMFPDPPTSILVLLLELCCSSSGLGCGLGNCSIFAFAPYVSLGAELGVPCVAPPTPPSWKGLSSGQVVKVINCSRVV